VRKRRSALRNEGLARLGDVSFIRERCAPGLPPQMLAQWLLPAKRKAIPSRSGPALRVDRQREMTNLDAERMLSQDATGTYCERHYTADSFPDAFRPGAGRRSDFSSFSWSEQSAGISAVSCCGSMRTVFYGFVSRGTRHPRDVRHAQVPCIGGSGAIVMKTAGSSQTRPHLCIPYRAARSALRWLQSNGLANGGKMRQLSIAESRSRSSTTSESG